MQSWAFSSDFSVPWFFKSIQCGSQQQMSVKCLAQCPVNIQIGCRRGLVKGNLTGLYDHKFLDGQVKAGIHAPGI